MIHCVTLVRRVLVVNTAYLLLMNVNCAHFLVRFFNGVVQHYILFYLYGSYREYHVYHSILNDLIRAGRLVL